ncbi:MAG: serine hydroxymethyltransferase, partial [Candidatus Parcubacteria bacterium]|nr:serine hydroxymethyltransferase [Candidatus Parcubacteria bacterium]
NMSGSPAQAVLESVGIYANKNMIPFDTRMPKDPSGLRLGTAALTTRGMKEEEMELIGQAICDILKNPTDVKIKDKTKKLVKTLTSKFPIYKDL